MISIGIPLFVSAVNTQVPVGTLSIPVSVQEVKILFLLDESSLPEPVLLPVVLTWSLWA